MWNETTMDALRRWIGPSTGLKHHPRETERFHQFVLAVWDQSHALWDECAARETLTCEAKRLHPDIDPDYFERFIERTMTAGTAILDRTFLD